MSRQQRATRRFPFPVGCRVRSSVTGETAEVLRVAWAQVYVRLDVSRFPDGRVQEQWWDNRHLTRVRT